MRQLKNFTNKYDKKQPTDEQTVKDHIGKYDGFSEDQLIEELAKNVKASKENGTYSDEQMRNFINMVSPQLTEEQRSKLNNLVGLIQSGDL